MNDAQLNTDSIEVYRYVPPTAYPVAVETTYIDKKYSYASHAMADI